MSTLLERQLRHHPLAVITKGELTCLLDGTVNSFQARLKRAVQKGDLIRIKRGLYCITSQLTLAKTHPFELAQKIYGPSYISLESALSYYGLIPEAVHSITSVTINRNNNFQTPMGHFVYCKLPIENFFVDTHLSKKDNHSFIMASPWKALFDYIYCYKKQYNALIDLVDDLRIDEDALPKIYKKNLEQFKIFYQTERINKFVDIIKEELIK